jgi:sphingolipid 4-desaturase/C4-monooxygenase
MGFHNEHHDFPMIAWNRLPHLYHMAPEFYQTLFAYQSYTRLLLTFIFDKNISAFHRWVRCDAPTAGQTQPPYAHRHRKE